MGAKHADLAALAALAPLQLAQALLVLEPALSLEADEGLEGTETRGAVRGGLDLAAVEVGVAAVEKPAVVMPHGDRGVSTGVARQRHDQDLGIDTRQRADGLEAHPFVAFDVVRLPVRAMFEEVLDVSGPLFQARALDRLHLGSPHVNLGAGEVRESAGMVDVEVSGNDPANVARREPKRLDLAKRSLSLVELRAYRCTERLAEELWRPHLVEAEAGVDEHECLAGFDQQDVRAHLPGGPRRAVPAEPLAAVGAHGRAPQMVDACGHERRVIAVVFVKRRAILSRVRIAVVLGSTRATRKSAIVGEWVMERANERDDLDAELVDLAVQNLPIFDEPRPPGAGDYQHEHTKRWAALINSFDGYVFVTPEYNHGIPGVLKNALDFVYAEWNNKVAGFVGYGNTGGARSVEQLRLVMAELQVADVRSAVALSIFTDFDKENNFTPADMHTRRINAMFDELVAWGEALKGVRVVRSD